MAITFLQLRTFATVCRTGSVRAASEELFVSQPSVSAAVTALEREMGVELFERRGRGIEPSPAGKAFLAYAREILALEARAQEAAREAAAPGTGTLAIVSVTTAAEFVLPALLKRFSKTHTKVEVSLEVGNRALVLDRLQAREADLGIGGRPPQGGPLAGERFAWNDLVVVGAPGVAGRAPASPTRLSQQTWLLREAGSGTRSTTEEFLESNGISPRSILTLGSNGAVKQGASIGLGLALLPEIAVRDEIRAGKVVRIAARGTPVRRGWYALYRDQAGLRPAARSFLEFLRKRRPASMAVDG